MAPHNGTPPDRGGERRPPSERVRVTREDLRIVTEAQWEAA